MCTQVNTNVQENLVKEAVDLSLSVWGDFEDGLAGEISYAPKAVDLELLFHDWQAQTQGLLKCRILLRMNFQSLLAESYLHNVQGGYEIDRSLSSLWFGRFLLHILKAIGSVRSSLSRYALVTLADYLVTSSTYLESESTLSSVVDCLLSRIANQGATFLVEDAKNVLRICALTCSMPLLTRICEHFEFNCGINEKYKKKGLSFLGAVLAWRVAATEAENDDGFAVLPAISTRRLLGILLKNTKDAVAETRGCGFVGLHLLHSTSSVKVLPANDPLYSGVHQALQRQKRIQPYEELLRLPHINGLSLTANAANPSVNSHPRNRSLTKINGDRQTHVPRGPKGTYLQPVRHPVRLPREGPNRVLECDGLSSTTGSFTHSHSTLQPAHRVNHNNGYFVRNSMTWMAGSHPIHSAYGSQLTNKHTMAKSSLSQTHTPPPSRTPTGHTPILTRPAWDSSPVTEPTPRRQPAARTTSQGRNLFSEDFRQPSPRRERPSVPTTKRLKHWAAETPGGVSTSLRIGDDYTGGNRGRQ